MWYPLLLPRRRNIRMWEVLWFYCIYAFTWNIPDILWDATSFPYLVIETWARVRHLCEKATETQFFHPILSTMYFQTHVLEILAGFITFESYLFRTISCPLNARCNIIIVLHDTILFGCKGAEIGPSFHSICTMHTSSSRDVNLVSHALDI